MTLAQIGQLIMTQVDDPTGVSFTPATSPNTTPPEVVAVVNEGQQLAVWLTLCLEKTAAFPIGSSHSIDANGCYYSPRPVLTDFLVPLKITFSGTRIRPATFADMEMENSAWQNTPGTPTRYACMGFNLLAINQQTAGSLEMTYASSAVPLVNDGDTPQLFEAYHQNLVDYGAYKVRLKEGAQSLARGLERLNLFLDDMTKLGDWVRARTAAARYDVTPFELALMDRSRLIGTLISGTTKGINSQAAMWKRRLNTERY
jgi:hypothetical protein